jgi:hypothetical protein
MGIASFIVGIASIVLYLVTFLPLLGWLNIVVLPLAVVGALLGLLGMFTGIAKGTATIGLILNAVVIIFSTMRIF